MTDPHDQLAAACSATSADSVSLEEFGQRYGDGFLKNYLATKPALLADALAEAPEATRNRAVAIQTKLLDLLNLDEAKRLHARAGRENRPPADVATLRDVLKRPKPPTDRIDGLAPWGASTLITAMRKTGKTTLIITLTHCLLAGEPFLGRFFVVPVTGRVAVLNYEVSAEQLGRWMEEAGLDPDRVVLVNLRGRSNPLADDGERAELAERLREAGVETVIVDPFSRAFTGDDQNNATQVARFTSMLDRFAREEVGATDLFLTNHAGWKGERTRGSSALEDWPDALWLMTKTDQEVRYFSAIGRDVDVSEDALTYDPETRRLELAGIGPRSVAEATIKNRELAEAVVELVNAEPGINASGLETALRKAGHALRKGGSKDAVQLAVDSGKIVTETGPRGATLHFPATTSPTSPDLPPTSPGEVLPDLPSSPYRGRGEEEEEGDVL